MPQITKTEMLLSITVIAEGKKTHLSADDAVKAADDYLVLTEMEFGNVEWKYAGFHRCDPRTVTVHYQRKE